MTAAEMRENLGLAPHPEGGWYRETWRDTPEDPTQRGAATVIYFLLAAGEESAWHKVDAAEIWLFHAGAALELRMGDMAAPTRRRLGPDIAGGETMQAVVPKGVWQTARPLGAWTLVSCVVSPAFSFEGFEMA